MNKKRILKLADVIEKAPHVIMGEEVPPAVYYTASKIIGFDMSVYNAHGSCGTVGCIAGHAAMIWPLTEKTDSRRIISIAAKALGLSAEEAGELFVPDHLNDFRAVTPAIAAEVLRSVANGISASSAWYSTGLVTKY